MFAHVCKESEWEQIGTCQILFTSLFLKTIFKFLKLIIRDSTRFNRRYNLRKNSRYFDCEIFQIVQRIERKQLWTNWKTWKESFWICRIVWKIINGKIVWWKFFVWNCYLKRIFKIVRERRKIEKGYRKKLRYLARPFNITRKKMNLMNVDWDLYECDRN